MKDAQIDALWIPRADEFLGEYVPVHNERLAFLTGFTGSAGVCVVTADRPSCCRWSLHAAGQDSMSFSSFEHEHLIETPPQRFLSEQLAEGDVVGVDARCLSLQSFETIQDCLAGKGMRVQATGQNLVDEIWLDRPKAPVALSCYSIRRSPECRHGQAISCR